MKQATIFTRWHRFDDLGNKQIKKFPLDYVVPPAEQGYTEWRRGTGPHSPEARAKIQEAMRKACLGVPKSIEQRIRMSLAKLGVPKSPEHRANMIEAQRRRRLKEKEVHSHANT